MGRFRPSVTTVFEEHSAVHLAASVSASGQWLPAGSKGVVVGILPGHGSYIIEFHEPFHIVMFIDAGVLIQS